MSTSVNIHNVAYIRARAATSNGTIWLSICSFDKRDKQTLEATYFIGDLALAENLASVINYFAPPEHQIDPESEEEVMF